MVPTLKIICGNKNVFHVQLGQTYEDNDQGLALNSNLSIFEE